ncbi:hypothetical protein MRX96_018253 [Rhipicephalus microplus]
MARARKYHPSFTAAHSVFALAQARRLQLRRAERRDDVYELPSRENEKTTGGKKKGRELIKGTVQECSENVLGGGRAGVDRKDMWVLYTWTGLQGVYGALTLTSRMREVLPVAMLLLLTLPHSAPFLRHRTPPFYDSDPLEDNVEFPGGKAAEVTFENMSSQLKVSRHSFSKSIVVTVADLMQQLRGQLFAFSYEVRHVEDGVDSMTTILFANETSDASNLLDIKGWKDLIKYSIIAMMVFVVVTMGGMMAGFTLGFANHYGHASPLERNALSNMAGYVLVGHCREHVGIGSLAGIKPKDLEAALDKIVEFQTDLVHQYKLDINALAEEVVSRYMAVQKFQGQFEKADLKTFLDFTIDECDSLKNNISSYIDEFDNIGDCPTIMDIFSDGFNILCNGMIDFVNGYWLSIMVLVGIYVYATYISLTASKYLYIMKSYTYEGEPVPPGLVPLTPTVKPSGSSGAI